MVRVKNIDNTIVTEIIKHLTILSAGLQEQVLDFVIKLNRSYYHGISGTQLIQYAGMISPDDLEIMSHAIENDCERIDMNEW
jgi:hypothetical protein